MRYGRRDKAHQWIQQAIKANPYFKPAAKTLASLGGEPVVPWEPPRRDRPKYLLIREWNHGFWSDVDHVLGQLLLAELTGRTPIVHWGVGSKFRPEGAPSDEDVWSLYFKPVSPLTIADVESETLTRFPNKYKGASLRAPVVNRWSGADSRVCGLEYFACDADVIVSDFHTSVVTVLGWMPAWHPLANAPFEAVYRDLVRRYLVVQPTIAAAAQEFYDRSLAGAPTLAAHVRGLDKIDEWPHLLEILTELQTYLGSHMAVQPTTRLFLMTDWTEALRSFTQQFPGRVVTTDAFRAESGTGIHRLGTVDGYRLGREVLIDSLIAAKCDRFVGTGPSSVSCAIEFLRDWPKDHCLFHGEHILTQFNTAMYTLPDHLTSG